MSLSQERTYYKALRQSITAIHTATPIKEQLNRLVHILSRCFDAGAAILLLDSAGNHLIHTAHWRLPPFFVQKGLLNAEKSLNVTDSNEPVVVVNIANDNRVQYPASAAMANIVSILSMTISCGNEHLGALRLYFKKAPVITSQDTCFIKAMAQLAGIALSNQSIESKQIAAVKVKATVTAGQVVKFAHQSEEEFAQMLDFYGIPWVYEPRSFPIGYKRQGSLEMFTPDFFLPDLDSYVELTTMKQSLVTHKNRKMRQFRERYPNIKINLLNKNDYEKLLAKYGVGSLAESRARGVKRIIFSAAEIDRRVREIATRISTDYADRRPILIGVQRGFLCFMADLIRQITVTVEVDYIAISYYGGKKGPGVRVTKDTDLCLAGRHVLLVEDIVDTGITLNYILNYLKAKQPASLEVCTLLDRKARRLVDTGLKYIGFEVPDEFVVGYGLDFHEEYRNLPYIAIPEIEAPINADVDKSQPDTLTSSSEEN